jgi:AI-2 transport protein TqsA
MSPTSRDLSKCSPANTGGVAGERTEDSAPQVSPTGGSALLALGAGVLVIAGISWGRDIFAPFLLAAALVVITYPVRGAVRRRVNAGWVATIALIASTYAILIFMAVLLFFAATRFAQLVPEFSGALDSAATGLAEALRAAGFDRASAQNASGWLEPGSLLAVAGAIVAYLADAVVALCFVFVYIFFLSVDATYFRLIRERFAASRRTQIESLVGLFAGIRRYFAVSAVFGAVVAAFDYVLLLVLQVPGAAVWGILAFVTNFIPNIGFVLGLLPAAVFAFLSGGWVTALVVVASYCLINVVLQTFIQPRFVGHAVDLSQTLTFGSVIFWMVVIGPLGAILAVPLTLATRAALIRPGRDGAWARWLTGDRHDHVPSPTTRE